MIASIPASVHLRPAADPPERRPGQRGRINKGRNRDAEQHDLALALLRVMHWAIAVRSVQTLAGGAARGHGGLRVLHRRRNGRSPHAAAAAARAAGAMVVVAEPRPGEAGAVFQIAAEAVRRPPMQTSRSAHVLVKSHALGEVHVGAAALSYSKDVGHDRSAKLVYKTQQQLSRGGAIIAKSWRSALGRASRVDINEQRAVKSSFPTGC